MNKYPIRDLIAMDPETIWTTMRGPFIVVCDDGELTTNRKETWFSTFAWRMFKDYPLSRYERRHHFAAHFKSKRFRPTTHFPLLEACAFSAYDAYRPALTPERLAEIVFTINIDICNEITTRFGKYVVSLDLFDYIDLSDHPAVMEIRQQTEGNEHSINVGIKAFEKLVMDESSPIGKLTICRMAQTGVIKLEQLTQCCFLRGYGQDSDGTIFEKPIMRPLIEGMRSMADFMIESRGAAVAIGMAGDPMQRADYSARKMQFIDMPLKNLHRGDCGSKKYMAVTVRDKATDELGRTTRSSDLDVLEGMYYHAEGEDNLQVVSASDRHLLGKTIYIRTVLDCHHPDPYGVCEVCVGKLADTYFESTNVGNNAANTLNKRLLQLLLSAKHYLSSADVEKIILDAAAQRYFAPDAHQTNYLLKESIKEGVTMLLSPAEAMNMTDVDLEDVEIRDLDKSRISEIRTVGFEHPDGFVESVQIGLKRSPAMMSHELLEYVKETRWDFDSRGNYRIRLDNWDFDQPAFSLPLRNYNIADHTKDLAEFIEASAQELYERDSQISPYAFLLELSDLVNHRSVVSLGVLAVVMKGLTIVSAEERNYHMPRAGERMGIGVLKGLMENRSLSVVMAYKGHRDAMKDPANYIARDRQDHPMDVMLMPHEALDINKYY